VERFRIQALLVLMGFPVGVIFLVPIVAFFSGELAALVVLAGSIVYVGLIAYYLLRASWIRCPNCGGTYFPFWGFPLRPSNECISCHRKAD